jgi:hypothetical protein
VALEVPMPRTLWTALAWFVGWGVACGSTTATSSPDASGSGGASAAGGWGGNILMSQLRIGSGGGQNCLPRSLSVASDGTVPCAMTEAATGACGCDASHGRTTADPALVTATRHQLELTGVCAGSTGIDCNDYCVCAITALTGAGLDACQNDLDASAAPAGYCYVDPSQDAGAPALVADCPATEQRFLRFVGGAEPTPGALVFIACKAQPL